ncbi:MAG: uroporphyrinogen-III C-methyltransferase [Myxococcota bacterium]
MKGFVSLVGAGPGDPELLTLRAVDRLKKADLVLHDALIETSILDHAARAQRFFVGKRAGRHSMSQRTINGLLIKHAREGKHIVRLKCGDPFVFGRGGEEAVALLEAGVPFEVVPGVSSSVSAPAFAGVPVTHRGRASGAVTVSGHSEAAYGPILSSLAPGSATVVVLMGFGHREAIAALMLNRGWSPDTPVVLTAGATTEKAHDHRTLLSALGREGFESAGAPVTMVIGSVAELDLRAPGPKSMSMNDVSEVS